MAADLSVPFYSRPAGEEVHTLEDSVLPEAVSEFVHIPLQLMILLRSLPVEKKGELDQGGRADILEGDADPADEKPRNHPLPVEPGQDFSQQAAGICGGRQDG